MRVLTIIGGPATGKTQVVKHFLKTHVFENQSEVDWKYSRFYLMEIMINRKHKIIVAGHYTSQSKNYMHMGSDMLSRGVLPDAKGFFERFSKNPEFSDYKVILEGDRFSYNSFFEFLTKLSGVQVKIICLKISEEQKKFRQFGRDNRQSLRFLKSMNTRIENILSNFDFIETLNNNTEEELGAITRTVIEY